MNRKYWPHLGLVAAVLVGIFDGLLFGWLDVSMTVDGRDVTVLVIGFYTVSFMVVGWLLGRVLVQRAQIREQLEAIEAAKARELHLEKLAAVGRLAAGVAHEVRNPLAVIRSSTALLAEGLDPADDASATVAGFIEEEVVRLDGFIGALLDYARPAQLELTATPVAEVVDRIAPLARSKAEADGVELALTLGDGVAQVDAEQLGPVIFGLIVNASEATPGGRVEVRAGPGPVIEVADDGPGVPAEDAARIFEPFFTTKAKGTGLGLAMAARIVEAHGGALRSVPGRGLGPDGRGGCFRVELAA